MKSLWGTPFRISGHATARRPELSRHTTLYVTILMQAKLTLRLDARLVLRAKRYAKRSGKSVSAVVADYFAALGAPSDEAAALPPKVRSLLGALGSRPVDEADYLHHLETKHR